MPSPTPSGLRACGLVLLALLAVVLQQPAAEARQPLSTWKGPRLCAKEGPAASSTWMNATRTCLKFHAHGSPIQAPADTNTSKWGQIWLSGMGQTAVVFIDRQGQTYPISPDVVPQDNLDFLEIWPLLVVKAELLQGTVVSFTPRLYVPYTTVMATMVNSQFEGTLTNFAPVPVGPNVTSWFKWTFGGNVSVTDPSNKYGTLLQGSFVNLFRSARAANGTCMPALCSDPSRSSDACKYYIEYFGNSTSSTEMTLSWDANMHAPGDTELVPMFTATHRQYMTRFVNLYQMLLPSTSFLPQTYSFIGHGTPASTPFNFDGALVKARPTKYC